MLTRLRSTLLITLVCGAFGATPAGAESFKLTEPDGTVHFTNAPNDPRYQRMGFTSGTQAGFLRLPQGGPEVAVVVLGARSNAGRFMETRHLFDWMSSKATEMLGGTAAAAVPVAAAVLPASN